MRYIKEVWIFGSRINAKRLQGRKFTETSH